ncbi:hypothetical protein DWX50_03265, partial [Agathobacter rectalis]
KLRHSLGRPSRSDFVQSELSDDDYERIAELEMYLDEIPDYLALKISTEYQELKIKMRARAE